MSDKKLYISCTINTSGTIIANRNINVWRGLTVLQDQSSSNIPNMNNLGSKLSTISDWVVDLHLTTSGVMGSLPSLPPTLSQWNYLLLL